MRSISWSSKPPCLARSRRPRGAQPPSAHLKAKICGITNTRDASCALDNGADLLGMIMWPKAKRSVTTDTARQIKSLTKEQRGEAEFPKLVGVFVEEGPEEIHAVCRQTEIDVVQLHGEKARSSLRHLDPALSIIYVLPVDNNGTVQESEEGLKAPVDFVLLDSVKGGSGVRFPLEKLTLPEWIHDKDMVRHGWILAGGLNPVNLPIALSHLSAKNLLPAGVDVSSGVCDESGLTKDKAKIISFISTAHSYSHVRTDQKINE